MLFLEHFILIKFVTFSSEGDRVEPRKPSSIKFSDCSDFQTVDPDDNKKKSDKDKDDSSAS